MKLSAKAAVVCAAISFGLVSQAQAQCTVKTEVRPTTQVQTLETRVDTDVVYTPIRNEVVTRMPVQPAVVAGLDTLKLQVMNGITSGIATGRITDNEAARLYAMIDDVARQEAEFKLAGLPEGSINNLMRKYHMVSLHSDELANNSAINDFMPNFENRRNAIARRILWHMASANLTPGEGEQLLTALNQITDNHAQMRATGGYLTADELESAHKDLFNLHKKLIARVSGTIARVVPVSSVERQEYLKRIQQGLAAKILTPEEGAKMIGQYNRLVLLENSIVAHDGPRADDIEVLAQEINNLTFILDRELRDRGLVTPAVAGASNKL